MPNYKVVDADHLDADLESIADSIRAKAGIEGRLEFPNGFKTAIEGITGSGGASDDVRYVTFMSEDGTEELGKIPVAVGYDCPNPKFAVTKESTPQFNFTHDYWATQPNGATDPNALKAVTEDRVVYATFISVLRYYTITYYDGDSVLKTESQPYGATPGYVAEKEGYGFEGWIPELATVTGNASYTAIWAAKLTFANASWAQIAEISEAGEAESYFSVGDTKTMQLNFSGTVENITVRIVGFNHDDLANGNGKAGISIALAQAVANDAIKVSEDTGYSTGYIWGTSAARKTLNSGAVYNALPSELRSVLKSVTKTSNSGNGQEGGNYGQNELYTTIDKVWLLSTTEIGLDNAYSSIYVKLEQGTKYAYYTDDNSRKLTLTTGGTLAYPLRSMYAQYRCSSVCVLSATGKVGYYSMGSAASTTYARVFGFCI